MVFCRTALGAFLLVLMMVARSLAAANGDPSFVLQSDAGDVLGLGQSYTYSLAEVEFPAPIHFSGTSIGLQVRGPGQANPLWQFNFVSPRYIPFRPGIYSLGSGEDASCQSFAYRWAGSYLESEYPSGQVEIKKVVFAEDGTIKSLWLTFELHHQGAIPALRGEYRYHLDATDAPFNFPPGVYAGAAQRAPIGTPFALPGQAGDDDVPSRADFVATWAQVEGPALIVFADVHDPQTTAIFSQPGIYRLQLSATDGVFSKESRVLIIAYDAAEVAVFRVANLGRGAEVATTYVYTPPDTDFVVSRLPNGGVGVLFSLFGPGTNLEFYPGGNQTLSVGSYPNANFAENGPAGSPRAYLSLGPVWADGPKGRFEVKEISYGPDGSILSCWITFAVFVSDGVGMPDVVRTLGEFRWHTGAPAGANLPPLVDAGADRTDVTRFEDPRLEARACDEARPGGAPLSTRWSQLSGPGPVVFADATQPTTKASFPKTGTYVLKWTVSDGELEISDTVTYTKGNLETFAAYRFFEFYGPSFADFCTPTDYVIRVEPWHYKGWSFQFWRRDGEINVINFEPPHGEELKPGIYRNAKQERRFAEDVVLDAGIPGTGEFQIHKYGEDGLWITFTVSIDGYVVMRGDLRLSADMRGYREPANAQPKLIVASQMAAEVGVPTYFRAAAEDDLLPRGQPLAAEWEQLSGPTAALFQWPDVLGTAVLFPQAGIYRFRARVSDGEFEKTGEITVFVSSGNRSFTGFALSGQQPIGLVTARVLTNGRFTAQVTYRGARYSLKGTLVNGQWSVRHAKLGLVTISLTDADSIMTGTLTLGGRRVTFQAGQAAPELLATAGTPSPHAGRYTFVLHATTPAPAGFGCGELSVKDDASFRLTGTLPDGTSFSQGGTLGLDGFLAFCTREAVGPLVFNAEVDPALSTLGGEIRWVKPKKSSARRFPAGFNLGLALFGTRYVPPLAGQNSLTLAPNATATDFQATAPDWATPLAQPFSLGLDHRGQSAVARSGFSFQVKPATGLFSGTFRDPQTGRRTKFRGALLQSEASGAGFFLRSHDCGAVQLALPPAQ